MRFNEAFLKKYLLLKRVKNKSKSPRKSRKDDENGLGSLEKGIKTRTSYEEDSDQSSEDTETKDFSSPMPPAKIELSTHNSSEKMYDEGLNSSARLTVNRVTMSPEMAKRDDTFSYIEADPEDHRVDGEFENNSEEEKSA